MTRVQSAHGGSLPSDIVVFLLTDIEGSTRRWESGAEAMRLALAGHDAIVRDAILRNSGHIFKTAGDAFFAAFASSAAAIKAAMEAQRGLAEANELVARIAIHAGPAELRGGDYFGPGINRAARLLGVTYGGQVLVSNTAADMARGYLPAGAALIDLGRHRLRDIAEPEDIYQLLAPGLRSDFPKIASLDVVIHNLPQQLTTFIGRDTEISAIRDRLKRHKLITLVGPGGSGKTRLALEIATAFLEDELEAVWFSDLSAIDRAELVAETLCTTLGIPIAGNQSAADGAIRFLSRTSALIVLDNCEHLLQAVAALVEGLLRSCPTVLVLATSRERIGLPGEDVHVVSSLAVPPPVASMTAEEALGFDSVRLFVERALLVVEDFKINDANAGMVAAICRQLDGIPLAIELAAPQLRVLQLSALATRLRERLLVVKGSRTALPRHQTLRALFDWSYNLLGEAERKFFRRLAVFSGSWTWNAAAVVLSASIEDEFDVLDMLSVLVDKSLVLVDRSGEEVRYGLLQPIREYAQGLLAEDEARTLRRELASYMVSLFQQAYASWPVTATMEWQQRYEPELENLRSSLDWAFGPEGDVRLGLELAGLAVRLWDDLTLFAERERWIALCFQHLDDSPDALTTARLWLGRVSNSAHGDAANQAPSLNAAALFRGASEPFGVGEALAKAGAAVLEPHSIEEAMPYLTEALAILEPLGPSKQLASCLRSHGIAGYFVSDFETGRAKIARSRAIAETISDNGGLAAAQIAAAELEFAAGNTSDAIAITQAMLDLEGLSQRHVILGLTNLAAYLLASDRLEEAAHAATEALRRASALNWPAAVARAVEHFALVAVLRGRETLAGQLFGCTRAFYAKGSATREFTELASHDRLVAIVDHLPPDRRDALLAEGALWTLNRGVNAILATL